MTSSPLRGIGIAFNLLGAVLFGAIALLGAGVTVDSLLNDPRETVIRPVGIMANLGISLLFAYGARTAGRAAYELMTGTSEVSGRTAAKMPASSSNTIWILALFAFIALTASIAMPLFHDLGRKMDDGASKGNLGALRSALNEFAGQNKGENPATLDALTTGSGILKTIPAARTAPYHADSSAVVLGTAPTDAGGWLYDVGQKVTPLRINCTHTDSGGRNWNAY